tara:strand:+ start:1731 stop:2435 length:705 start_codon:yes stop_codon:yes gene_type:complete
MKTYFQLREELKTNKLNEGPVGKAIGKGLGMAVGGLAGGIGGGLAGGAIAPGIGNAIGFGAGAIAGGGAGGDIGAKIGDVVSSPYAYAKKGVKALLKKRKAGKATANTRSNQTPPTPPTNTRTGQHPGWNNAASSNPPATQSQPPSSFPKINASPAAINKWKAKRLAQNNKSAGKPVTSPKPGDPMTSKKGGSFLMGVDGKATSIPANHPNVAKHRQDILNIVNRKKAALGKGK